MQPPGLRQVLCSRPCSILTHGCVWSENKEGPTPKQRCRYSKRVYSRGTNGLQSLVRFLFSLAVSSSGKVFN
jgi:hypothetical protein